MMMNNKKNGPASAVSKIISSRAESQAQHGRPRPDTGVSLDSPARVAISYSPSSRAPEVHALYIRTTDLRRPDIPVRVRVVRVEGVREAFWRRRSDTHGAMCLTVKACLMDHGKAFGLVESTPVQTGSIGMKKRGSREKRSIATGTDTETGDHVHGIDFDVWLRFEARVAHLSPTAKLRIEVWERLSPQQSQTKSRPSDSRAFGDVLIAGAIVPLFNTDGMMLQGSHRFPLTPKVPMLQCSYPQERMERKSSERFVFTDEKEERQLEKSGKVTNLIGFEHAVRKYRHGLGVIAPPTHRSTCNSPDHPLAPMATPWLTRMTIARARDVLAQERIRQTQPYPPPPLNVTIELPSYSLPVLYHEQKTPSTKSLPLTLLATFASERDTDSSSKTSVVEPDASATDRLMKDKVSGAIIIPQARQKDRKNSSLIESKEPLEEEIVKPEEGVGREEGLLVFDGGVWVSDPALEFGLDSEGADACASLRLLDRNTGLIRTIHERMLKKSGMKDRIPPPPGPKERLQLRDIVKRAGAGNFKLSVDDRVHLWRYRWYLRRDPMALYPFLHCVEWSDEQDTKETEVLLEAWGQISCLEALELLTEEFRDRPLVRRFAVKTLESVGDTELEKYLLPLTQALRYDRSVAKCNPCGATGAPGAGTATAEGFNRPLIGVDPESKNGRAGLSEQKGNQAGEMARGLSLPGFGVQGRALKPTVDSPGAEHGNKKPIGRTPATVSPKKNVTGGLLETFLMARCCQSFGLASSFSWFLKVEAEGKDDDAVFYNDVHSVFIQKLKSTKMGIRWEEGLRMQRALLQDLESMQRQASTSGGRTDNWIANMRDSMQSADGAFSHLTEFQMPVRCPLHPHHWLTGIIPEKTTMFKSAMAPLLVTFRMKGGGVKRWIFKSGDDLRQDQLVMCLIELMDELFKSLKVDLCLTPYRILTTGVGQGLVEFVENSSTLSKIRQEAIINANAQVQVANRTVPGGRPNEANRHGEESDLLQGTFKSQASNISAPIKTKSEEERGFHTQGTERKRGLSNSGASLMSRRSDNIASISSNENRSTNSMSRHPWEDNENLENASVERAGKGSLLAFLKRHNKAGREMAQAMDTFVRSCAGYCVITYVLGAGDRHLDNLLMTTRGYLFHIDFGYIFGKDPKFFAPPMRVTTEMIELIEAAAQQHDFTKYCCWAFNRLRSQSRRILNLIKMMKGMLPGNSQDSLLHVQDKLALELSDAEAEKLILSRIKASANAYFPEVFEYFHKVAVARR
mmetsp:Transcript_5448/g.13266  ORF Transcript_5448/g.13266 Transcript_5448/m.13266 type:complete len:1254 (-) Transcript_5448:126-3887(-)